ncbi:MAG TPA: Hsp20/alpha crystallin family protein [Promineifilum sp.]|nr:Hsp20/alpha crystallin family protein [Promineifilum sp.]HRO89406.1 Hsp20/alpha crystallin family protein [Promineifilum sp.]HRQ13906.1 Hsp20/alpha crystallin family protein [Promineifilum sp.]
MARLIRWNNPYPIWLDRDPVEMMDRMLGDVGRNMVDWNGGRSWNLPLDVMEKDAAYVIHASIPGIDPDALDITLTDNVLTIHGETRREDDEKDEDRYMMRERRFGSFTRSITFPMPIEANKIEASCVNGELILTLPKAEAVRPHRIAVNKTHGRKTLEGQARGSNGNGRSHGFGEGQADLPVSAEPKSEGWAEGQAKLPPEAEPKSEGWAEGQAKLPPEAEPKSRGWAEGQATRDRA